MSEEIPAQEDCIFVSCWAFSVRLMSRFLAGPTYSRTGRCPAFFVLRRCLVRKNAISEAANVPVCSSVQSSSFFKCRNTIQAGRCIFLRQTPPAYSIRAENYFTLGKRIFRFCEKKELSTNQSVLFSYFLVFNVYRRADLSSVETSNTFDVFLVQKCRHL